MLAENFAELLKLSQVGINENFFCLGRRFITCDATHHPGCASLSINMPIVTVFKSPTIAELAVEVNRYQMNNGTQIPC